MTKPKLLLASVLIFLSLLFITIRYLFNPKILGDTAKLGSTVETILNTQKSNTNTNNNKTETPIQTVATNLSIPWEIAFLPDSSLLVTQRPGTILHIKPESQTSITVSGVEHNGEGGLLGLALHPNYKNNKLIYVYLTSKTTNGLINRVEQYKFNEATNQLSQRRIIIQNIPGASYHDGGRIAFGPDGYLYITTGDAGQDKLAQNTSSIAGKILRITDEGKIPQDNPFGNTVYSYGHRNPQGIAWDSQNRLWATEHGPSFLTTGMDEVNLIKPGQNYGWPTITGNQTQEGMITPVIQSGSEVTWAPAGLAIYQNILFFAGLKGESLYTAKISGEKLTNFKEHFVGEFGRLRAVVIDPEQKWLYLTTSNTDGRGNPKENDDKIIKINLNTILESL